MFKSLSLLAAASACVVVTAGLTGPLSAAPLDLDNLSWSVQYIIDQSQTVLGQNQYVAPRDNRGLAISPDGKYLYAGYNNGPDVRKIDLSTGDYTQATLALTTDSRGKAIAVDDQGRVYLADGASIKIYDANLSGVQQTVGTATCEGVALTRLGSQLALYGTDRANGTLTRYLLDESGGAVSGWQVDNGWGTAGQVMLGTDASLRGAEVDSTGRIWVAGFASNAVYVVAANGQSVQTISDVATPMDIGFDEGRALITQYRQRRIDVIDTTTLDPLTALTISTDTWANMALDPDGQQSGGGIDDPGFGAFSGIVVMPGQGFYLANEAGQTPDEKSIYGGIDAQSGWLNGQFYADLTHDDNDPILAAGNLPGARANMVPEPFSLALLALGGLAMISRRRDGQTAPNRQ